MLNSVAPNMVTFTRAATAASELFALIDRTSEINPFDPAGEKPASLDGCIDIRGLTFSYPTRSDVTVLDDFNLHIPAGKVTALVVSIPTKCAFLINVSLKVYRDLVVLGKAQSSACSKGGMIQAVVKFPSMVLLSKISTYNGFAQI